jgi:uncharacterized Tic20 family protein
MAKKEETPEISEGPGGTSEDVEQGQVSAEVNKEACMWAMFCHLAGLCAFAIPFVGNIVGPLILWQIKKDEYPFVDEQGKEAVNFRLISVALSFVCVGIFLLAAVGVVDLVFLLIATVKANSGQHYHYPLTIRFIK